MICQRCRKIGLESLRRITAQGREPLAVDLCDECVAAWDRFKADLRSRVRTQRHAEQNIRVSWGFGFGTSGTTSTTTGGNW